MIKLFVDSFMEQKKKLEEIYSKKHPFDYKEIVENVIKTIDVKCNYNFPDPQKINVIDDKDYQRTLLFILRGKYLQRPMCWRYWAISIFYGTGCDYDTLQYIQSLSDEEIPTQQQINDYMQLSLNVVQNIIEIPRFFV